MTRAPFLCLALLMAWCGRDGVRGETRLQPSQVRNWSQVQRPVYDPLDARRNQTKAAIDQISMDAEFMGEWARIAALWQVAVLQGIETYPPEIIAAGESGRATPPWPDPVTACIISADRDETGYPPVFCVRVD